MKSLNDLKVSLIEKNEMQEINGGDGLMYDLGKAAHEAWCNVRDSYMEAMRNRQVHYDNGGYDM